MAYTKYSLTPANNTATPPDGAPEGMLPSAVNDTMRDMMAQIRDCGDGIRDGTYTMTAAKITGGTITGVTFTGNTFSNPTITGVSTFAAGTVSAPAITTTGDTNTGIFFPAADTIAFAEGGAEAMRIDSSGNVGIGATSPNGKLEVVSTSAGANTNTLFLTNASSNASTATSLVFGVSTAPTIRNATIQAINAGGNVINLAFLTSNADAPAERMRIDSSGNVLVGITSARANAGDVQVSKGISFPATQSAQSDANTLDDYEEGTWTPTLVGSSTAGTYTFSTNYSYYTKIGNQVTVNAYLVLGTASGGSGSAKFGGLPFSKSANQISTGSVGASGVDFGANATSLTVTSWTISSSTEFYISETNDNATETGLNISGISSTDVLFFSMTYFV